MSCLPEHGQINCIKCYISSKVEFDKSLQTSQDWRIKANPLAWGNPEAEIVILGFSKGPTQDKALTTTDYNEIAYKGSRRNVGKILAHIGLIAKAEPEQLKLEVDRIIADKAGRFHFGSLIRCTVEQYDVVKDKWKGSGGGMLDKFVATSFGQKVVGNCMESFLVDLPSQTKLVIMFGLGSKGNYVRAAYQLFQKARPGNWTKINDVAYSDGIITVVHVEHFASQGALIPNWLGEREHERSQLGRLAQEGVNFGMTQRK